MRSFNYLHTRFAHGDDFVCDAPDAVASSVELLLTELPPPRESIDSGAVSLDEGLGTLVFVRRSRPGSQPPASPLGARREGAPRDFIHALVLSGHHPPERIDAAKRLLLERYAPNPAEEISRLCRRLADVEIVQAAREVSERFVDPERVRALCESAPPPRRPLWRARHRSPSLTGALTGALGALRSRLSRAGRGVSRDVGDAALRLDRSRQRAARATRARVRRGGDRIHGALDTARNQTSSRLGSIAHSLRSGAAWVARIAPFAISGAAFASSAFLLGYAVALPPAEPLLVPEPVALPHVASAPPVACVEERPEPPRLDTGTVSLQADLAAAISRLEALEIRAGGSGGAPPSAAIPVAAVAETPVAPAPTPRAPAPIAARPRPHQRHSRVVADVLVVRAGPSTSYNEVGRLEEGTAVRAASREKDGWTRIAEPVGGWVASRYLRD